MSRAKKFIKNRLSPLAITQNRINTILSYVLACYEQLRRESVTYSRKFVKDSTRDKFEDHLKKRLVHDYLKKFKRTWLKNSPLEDIMFECEPEMPYNLHSSPGVVIEANDKIDIKVNHLGLQTVWSDIEDDIYFAIECKIINSLSDNKHYERDIQKFCDRAHLHHRLPIEGMIAFIESKTLDVSEVVSDLNARLQKSTIIKTIQLLHATTLQRIDDSYSSKHRRNFNKTQFNICHLYLDYSRIIVH